MQSNFFFPRGFYKRMMITSIHKSLLPHHRLIEWLLAKCQAFNESFQSRFNVYLIAKKNFIIILHQSISHKNLSTTPFITCNTCYSFSCSDYIVIVFCLAIQIKFKPL